MYQNTQKIILLWNMKSKLYAVIQKSKKLKKYNILMKTLFFNNLKLCKNQNLNIYII
jgi:hypothetical protein